MSRRNAKEGEGTLVGPEILLVGHLKEHIVRAC